MTCPATRSALAAAPQVTRVPADKLVDTNGAGDAFVGGFLSQLVRAAPGGCPAPPALRGGGALLAGARASLLPRPATAAAAQLATALTEPIWTPSGPHLDPI